MDLVNVNLADLITSILAATAEAMTGSSPKRFVKNAKDFAQRTFNIADGMLEKSDRPGVQP